MEVAEPNDSVLLESYRRTGSEEAFAVLVARHRALVSGATHRILSGDAEAEDAAQAVFVALAFKPPSLDPQQSLGAWLHRVAVRSALDFRESAMRRAMRETESVATSPPSPPRIPEGLDLALEKLPRKISRTLVGHYLEGWSIEELAAREACQPSTISMRLTRGRQQLRKRLKQDLAFPSIAAPFLAARFASADPVASADCAIRLARVIKQGTLPAGARAESIVRIAQAISQTGFGASAALLAGTPVVLKTVVAVSAALALAVGGVVAHQAWEDRGFTRWMEQPELDAYLDSLAGKQPPGVYNWITAVEGRLHRRVVQYRVRHTPAPSRAHWWYWFIDMTPEEFAANGERLAADGFTKAYENSYSLPDGDRRFQAVWQKVP